MNHFILEIPFVFAKTNHTNQFYMSLSGLDDEALVTRLQSGEREAFTILIQRWQHKVYAFCLRQLQDPTLAEEAAQDVFLKVFKGIHNFQHQSLFSTWLFRILTNHCHNLRSYHYLRKRQAHEPLEGTQEDNPRTLPDEQTAHTGAHIEQCQLKSSLNEALNHLPEDQREVLILRDVQDHSYDEIAQILNISVGTVKSRVHRARNNLRPILQNLLRGHP